MQPFTGQQKIVIEKRDTDGKLDFTGEKPPTNAMTFDQLYDRFFAANPDGVGSWENLQPWLSTKGWSIRAKTW